MHSLNNDILHGFLEGAALWATDDVDKMSSDWTQGVCFVNCF